MLWGENGHNSINIRANGLNYLHSIDNLILVKVTLKRDTRLQKNRAEFDFLLRW